MPRLGLYTYIEKSIPCMSAISSDECFAIQGGGCALVILSI
uniref:Uncharacterized protein n=1 Tax=Anguilla anguilla TaxID=7936 RepID=A0A0E9QBT0_ANGAN